MFPLYLLTNQAPGTGTLDPQSASQVAPCARIRKIASRFLLAAMFMLNGHTTLAGSATWKLNPSSGNWNTASNWTPGTVPNSPSDTATFASSNITNAAFSANTQVNGIVFNAAASAFTITDGGVGANFTFTISGVGIANNSGVTQNFFVGKDENSNPATIAFTNNATAGQNTRFTVDGGFLEFRNSSTAQGAILITRNNSGAYFNNTSSASSASITNEGGTSSSFTGWGGYTFFEDSATAGSAMIVNNAEQQPGGAAGGQVQFGSSSSAGTGTFVNHGGAPFLSHGDISFNGTSTASSATFLNEGGMGDGGLGGSIEFFSDATAGSAVITNNGGTGNGARGAITEFFVSSTAGASTLIGNGGTGGGTGGQIVFWHSFSSGGTSQIKVFGNGRLDISLHETPDVTIGSLEGSGLAFLGANHLIVGSNNLSTLFSGLMQDGGANGGTGGSVTKIGTATLRISGANTYTGGTIVNAGRLMANNSTGSATSTGAVVVNNSSSVLGGTGMISGPVTINTNAAILGGDATMASGTLTLANQLTLNTASMIQLVLGPSGAHTSLARTGGTWTFAPNQKFTFLDLGAQPGVYDNIITGLSGNPGGTVSWTITNAGFVGAFTYDGAGNIDLNLTAVSTPLQLTTAVSRKTHGGAGDFDIPLPLTGEPGVECRSSAGNHTLVFAFNNNVVSGNATVTSGAVGVTGTPTFVGNTMTVNLTGVADVQKIIVTLSNVTDSFSQVLPDKAVSMNMLIGDTSGNKTVNGTDVSQTKLQSGSVVTGANFREDVNVNGSINGTDVSVVKLRSGSGLP